MIQKKAIIFAITVVVAAAVFATPGCDSTEAKNPQLILNVKLDEVLYPVSSANRIYAVFYIANDWATPWMTLNFPMSTVITPELNIGDYPLFFEVWYDVDGDGLPTAGVDFYQGWLGKIDRTSDTLDPLPVAETEVMMLNFDLDNHGTF
ncbi:MAG TPA: hypothetical protein PLA65_09235 [Spirochaetota bacterium]|nr:hypothetical protein [Spirochaetota bacterium]HOD16924.1 hypothetical protein [Spirochaetota bacterium]HPG50823.1 hypothetical protein [Spirochaetota bacterium]HPN12233.1 hypothetical protein [Spirochaetota bacterium]